MKHCVLVLLVFMVLQMCNAAEHASQDGGDETREERKFDITFLTQNMTEKTLSDWRRFDTLFLGSRLPKSRDEEEAEKREAEKNEAKNKGKGSGFSTHENKKEAGRNYRLRGEEVKTLVQRTIGGDIDCTETTLTVRNTRTALKKTEAFLAGLAKMHSRRFHVETALVPACVLDDVPGMPARSLNRKEYRAILRKGGDKVRRMVLSASDGQAACSETIRQVSFVSGYSVQGKNGAKKDGKSEDAKDKGEKDETVTTVKTEVDVLTVGVAAQARCELLGGGRKLWVDLTLIKHDLPEGRKERRTRHGEVSDLDIAEQLFSSQLIVNSGEAVVAGLLSGRGEGQAAWAVLVHARVVGGDGAQQVPVDGGKFLGRYRPGAAVRREEDRDSVHFEICSCREDEERRTFFDCGTSRQLSHSEYRRTCVTLLKTCMGIDEDEPLPEGFVHCGQDLYVHDGAGRQEVVRNVLSKVDGMMRAPCSVELWHLTGDARAGRRFLAAMKDLEVLPEAWRHHARTAGLILRSHLFSRGIQREPIVLRSTRTRSYVAFHDAITGGGEEEAVSGVIPRIRCAGSGLNFKCAVVGLGEKEARLLLRMNDAVTRFGATRKWHHADLEAAGGARSGPLFIDVPSQTCTAFDNMLVVPAGRPALVESVFDGNGDRAFRAVVARVSLAGSVSTSFRKTQTGAEIRVFPVAGLLEFSPYILNHRERLYDRIPIEWVNVLNPVDDKSHYFFHMFSCVDMPGSGPSPTMDMDDLGDLFEGIGRAGDDWDAEIEGSRLAIATGSENTMDGFEALLPVLFRRCARRYLVEIALVPGAVVFSEDPGGGGEVSREAPEFYDHVLAGAGDRACLWRLVAPEGVHVCSMPASRATVVSDYEVRRAGPVSMAMPTVTVQIQGAALDVMIEPTPQDGTLLLDYKVVQERPGAERECVMVPPGELDLSVCRRASTWGETLVSQGRTFFLGSIRTAVDGQASLAVIGRIRSIPCAVGPAAPFKIVEVGALGDTSWSGEYALKDLTRKNEYDGGFLRVPEEPYDHKVEAMAYSCHEKWNWEDDRVYSQCLGNALFLSVWGDEDATNSFCKVVRREVLERFAQRDAIMRQHLWMASVKPERFDAITRQGRAGLELVDAWRSECSPVREAASRTCTIPWSLTYITSLDAQQYLSALDIISGGKKGARWEVCDPVCNSVRFGFYCNLKMRPIPGTDLLALKLEGAAASLRKSRHVWQRTPHGKGVKVELPLSNLQRLDKETTVVAGRPSIIAAFPDPEAPSMIRFVAVKGECITASAR